MRQNKADYFRRSGWNPYKNPHKRKQPFPEWQDWEGESWSDASGGPGGNEHQGGGGNENQGGWKQKKYNKGRQRVIWWRYNKHRQNYAGGAGGGGNTYIKVPPKASTTGEKPADSDMEVEVGTDGGTFISNFPPIPPGFPGVSGSGVPALPGTGKQYVLTFICCRGCFFIKGHVSLRYFFQP